jgi:hypothetical protein
MVENIRMCRLSDIVPDTIISFRKNDKFFWTGISYIGRRSKKLTRDIELRRIVGKFDFHTITLDPIIRHQFKSDFAHDFFVYVWDKHLRLTRRFSIVEVPDSKIVEIPVRRLIVEKYQ